MRSKQWIGPGGTAPKRTKTQRLAGKVIDCVFCDSSGILFIDYLKKEKSARFAGTFSLRASRAARFTRKFERA